MKYFLLSLLLLVIYPPTISAQLATERSQLYIERFREIAIQEMERAGIPASIKLAQGLLESGAGTSQLARSANNHFGIKCGSNWNGKEVYREDDDYDNQGQLIKSCFRGYRNANASFVAHSEFLRDPKKAFRYGFLFRLNPRDYKRWAEGLRRAGYATDPNYPQKLIGMIERYNLDQYDRLPIAGGDDPVVVVTRPGSDRPIPTRPTDVNTPIENLVTGFLNTNDVTYFVSDEAIRVDEVARRVDISLRKLIEYNEPIASGSEQVLPGQRVFIQKKRKSYRGRQSEHIVQPGETLQEISDRYAIRMDKLLKRNRLDSPNQRVAAGEKIKLRGGKVKEAPKLGGTPAVEPDAPNVPTDEEGNLDMDDLNDPTPPMDTDEETPPVVIPVPTPPIPNPNPKPIPPTVGNEPDFGTPTTPPVTPAPPVTPPSRPDVTPPNPPFTPPPATEVTPRPTPPPTTTTPPTTTFYTVIKGDTLYSISRRYGMTVDRVKQLNGLTSNIIAIGQRLKVE